jgi:hypothetical protein
MNLSVSVVATGLLAACQTVRSVGTILLARERLKLEIETRTPGLGFSPKPDQGELRTGASQRQ